MSRAEERLAALAEDIGPRPACDEGEREAGDYIRDILDGKDLAVEQQRIRSPRTYSYTYVAYFAGAAAVAVLSRWLGAWVLPAAVAIGVLFYFELDARPLIGRLMPKGQSRNLVARLHSRSAGAPTVVVICAHYDSAQASLSFAPRMVRGFRLSFLASAVAVWGICILAVVRLPFDAAPAGTWSWWAMIAFAAYLLIPVSILLHRELAMPWVDGANDNAAGVVAMLEVMERLTTTRPREGVPQLRPVERPDRGGAETSGQEDSGSGADAFGSPGQDDEAVLGYEAAERDAPDDWGDIAFTDWLGVDDRWDVRVEGQRLGEYGAIEARPAHGAEPAENEAPQIEDEGEDAGPDVLPAVADGGDALAADHADDLAASLFDTPDLTFGMAGDTGGPIESAGGRGFEPGLADKEVWFVATGCEEVGSAGMIEFLKRYGTRLRDAFFINIDNIGAGRLALVTDEGLVRYHGSDRVLLGVAREVADAKGFDMVARPYHLLPTDATAALVRGHRAMSVMAFDDSGMLPNWHWETDTVDRVRSENVDAVADFVYELIKAL